MSAPVATGGRSLASFEMTLSKRRTVSESTESSLGTAMNNSPPSVMMPVRKAESALRLSSASAVYLVNLSFDLSAWNRALSVLYCIRVSRSYQSAQENDW